MTATETVIQTLVNIGFTPVESEIYIYLLAESPASGYRIAQATGKPAAQIYRAIESLVRKGAVIIAEGKTRLCRAVPIESCLKTFEKSFIQRTRQAGDLLRALPKPVPDEHVYRLVSREHVIEHSKAMLKRAKKIVLLDLFPEPFRILRDDVAKLASRGVIVAAKVYEPCEMEGVSLKVISVNAQRVMERWEGQQVSVTIDGLEFLTAMLTRDGRDVHNAFWSANSFLAAMYYNGLSCELSLTLIEEAIINKRSSQEVRGILEQCTPFFLTNSPAMDAIELPATPEPAENDLNE